MSDEPFYLEQHRQAHAAALRQAAAGLGVPTSSSGTTAEPLRQLSDRELRQCPHNGGPSRDAGGKAVTVSGTT